MASTYETLLRLELMADGDKNNTWGQILNTVIELFAESISGLETVSVTSSDVTLTTNNGSSDQARNMILNLTGTLTTDCNVIVPSSSKVYVIQDENTRSGNTLTVKTSGGSGITLKEGAQTILFCDGTNVYELSPDALATDIEGNGKTIEDFVILDASEIAYDLSSISGAVAVDYENGHYQHGIVTGNISGITVSNWPASGKAGWITLELTQDGTGSRTLTLSSAYETVGGAGITLTTTSGAKDKIRMETRDGGTTIDTFANLDIK